MAVPLTVEVIRLGLLGIISRMLRSHVVAIYNIGIRILIRIFSIIIVSRTFAIMSLDMCLLTFLCGHTYCATITITLVAVGSQPLLQHGRQLVASISRGGLSRQ
jgi:hypothetical protein